jgi:hypothetical protein
VVGSFDLPVLIHNPASIGPTSTQSVVAATRSALAPITVSDIDSDVLRVTLNSVGGTLQWGPTSGLYLNQSGSIWLAEGSKSDLNAALGQLAFTANSGRSTASIQVTVDDKDALTVEAPRTISLSVAAAPPSVSLPVQYNAKIGAATLLSGFSVQDADSSSVTITLSASAGSFTLPGSLPGGVTLRGQTASSLILSGSPALLQQALALVSYTAPADIASAPTLSLSVNDGVNAPVSRSLTVTLVDNEAPAAGRRAAHGDRDCARDPEQPGRSRPHGHSNCFCGGRAGNSR